MRSTREKFGFWSIVLLCVNAVIGSGIFLSPGGVILKAGTLTPLVYVLAAVFATILAMIFASAAKYTNKNGAAYAYTKVAFGGDLGFYIGITRFVAAAIAWGVMATAVVRSVMHIFGIEANHQNITIGFIILMLVVLGIVLSGTKVTKIVSNISSAGKFLALVLAIVAGFVIFFLTGQNHFNEVNTVKNEAGDLLVKPMNLSVFVTAVIAAFYAFTGFESVGSAASEMEEPEKNLPRAIPLAMMGIALIYLGMVTVCMIINPVDIMTSKQPVVLAEAFKNPVLKALITYGAIISMFGINVAAAFSTPRIFEAMAKEGQVPEFLCRQNKAGVPYYSFVVTAILAIFVPMAFNYSMNGIMIISSIARFAQFLIVPLAVIIFYLGRSKESALPAKKNFFTDVILSIVGFVLTIFLLYNFDWVGNFTTNGAPNYFAIVAMVVGYVVLPIVLYVPYKMGLYKKTK